MRYGSAASHEARPCKETAFPIALCRAVELEAACKEPLTSVKGRRLIVVSSGAP